MHLISEITDKDILGVDRLSKSNPRFTARAILINNNGLYAIMFAEKFNLYSLPGGGIEENEDRVAALKREILEETGCQCDSITELGYVYENRAHCDFTQYSYYYVVTTDGPLQATQLTDDEINNNTKVQWHAFDNMKFLITSPLHDTNQRKFIQAKDTAALNEYMINYIK